MFVDFLINELCGCKTITEKFNKIKHTGDNTVGVGWVWYLLIFQQDSFALSIITHVVVVLKVKKKWRPIAKDLR